MNRHSKAVSLFKKTANIHRTYREGKSAAVEQSVTLFETNVRPYFFLLFFALNLLAWSSLVWSPIGPVEAFDQFGFSPILVIFVISYFTVFLGSKIIWRPTREEVEDDTSSFALFSACPRREYRALLSIGLSVVHTLIFFGYLISKDPKLLDALGGKTS